MKVLTMLTVYKIKLLYRKIRFHFSKKDINAILKYDPLDILKN